MMKNFSQMMKQAQEMQKQMQQVQESLDTITVEGNAGGGMINVTMTCKGKVNAIKIDKSLVDPAEVDMLEDLVVAAVNDARANADARSEEEMKNITGGLGLPDGMKLPF